MHKTYNIRESLGSGGCGDVFLGVHKRNGTRVAIKTIVKKRYTNAQSGSNSNALKEVPSTMCSSY